jgi:hypothetical protein
MHRPIDLLLLHLYTAAYAHLIGRDLNVHPQQRRILGPGVPPWREVRRTRLRCLRPCTKLFNYHRIDTYTRIPVSSYRVRPTWRKCLLGASVIQAKLPDIVLDAHLCKGLRHFSTSTLRFSIMLGEFRTDPSSYRIRTSKMFEPPSRRHSLLISLT